MKTTDQARIFISYSHHGNGLLWKERLYTALAVFEKHHLLEPWHDDKTMLGEDWHTRINTAMEDARLAILLLTNEFLKSPFVLDHELPVLQRRQKEEGLIVAPILCERCDWPQNEWLASLQIKPRVQTVPTPLAALMPAAVLEAGSYNRERAAALVEQAQRLTQGSGADPIKAASLLRLAIGCHPGEAGKLILTEWSRRLGRDTGEEFRLAAEIVYARELCSRMRYAEARQHLKTYLKDEPKPAHNALVMDALCELMDQAGDADQSSGAAETMIDMKKKMTHHTALRERLGKEAGKEISNLTKDEFQTFISNKPHVETILRELQSLVQQIDVLRPRIEQTEKNCCQIITEALNSPKAVKKRFPALALAAKEAPEQLRRVLDCQCRFVPTDEEMFLRYGDIDKVVEMRALFKLLHRLSSILHRFGPAEARARMEAMYELQKLAAEPWLPESAERALRALAEEFHKGEWDRLLANQISYSLQESMSVCYTRIQDLLSDMMSNAVPLAEPLATRIHIAQTIDGKYRKALAMMFDAKVGFGRAIQQRWTMLNSDIRDMPPDGKLIFDPKKRMISLESNGKKTPLLQSAHLADDDIDYVSGIIANTEIPRLINPFATSLAGGILAMEVEPQPTWQLWCDAMKASSKELLFTIALFGYDASPMPEFAPEKGKHGEEMEQRLNKQPPRNVPKLDLQWNNLGMWEKFLGPNPDRKIVTF